MKTIIYSKIVADIRTLIKMFGETKQNTIEYIRRNLRINYVAGKKRKN